VAFSRKTFLANVGKIENHCKIKEQFFDLKKFFGAIFNTHL